MAFAPMLFMSGIFGKFIANIPLGVIAALIISLFECFFILPHHLGAWIKDDTEEKKKMQTVKWKASLVDTGKDI